MTLAINTHNTLNDASSLKPFRIFLASPGDVPLERILAREAIVQINGERQFRGRIALETIAWDQPGAAVAMEAAMNPQQAIALGLPKPEDCDLVVVILWSRIGTSLPAESARPFGQAAGNLASAQPCNRFQQNPGKTHLVGTSSSRFWPENVKDNAACTYANVFDQNNEARIKNTFGCYQYLMFRK